MSTLQERTQEAIDAGFPVGELARAAGKTPSAVSQWLSGETKTLKAESAVGLSTLTGWNFNWWISGKGPKSGTSMGGSSVNELPAVYSVSSAHKRTPTGRLNVSEIVRTQPGGMLETVVQPAGARLGYVEVHQVYDGMMAIKVRGDALAPAVMDGEMLIVEMNTQCAPGDRVLIELVDGSRMCKRLMFERADAITVADMVTSGQMTFEREVVARMSPITAVYSVNRWHR